MHVHICIFSLISVVSPLETIKQESQNPVKATVIKEKKNQQHSVKKQGRIVFHI